MWFSVLYSMSAFCNGGFDLMGDYTGTFTSLTGFRNVFTIMIMGGISFYVWKD